MKKKKVIRSASSAHRRSKKTILYVPVKWVKNKQHKTIDLEVLVSSAPLACFDQDRGTLYRCPYGVFKDKWTDRGQAWIEKQLKLVRM